MRPSVFISSTFLEFKDERRLLHHVISNVLGLGCDIAENLSCDSPDLSEELKHWIDRNDIVVLLLGQRYGSMGPGDISWTAAEVAYAVQTGRKVCPYKKEPEPQQPIVDIDMRKLERLEEFEREVRLNISGSIPYFSDSDTLVGFVIRDLCREVRRFERSDFEDTFIR